MMSSDSQAMGRIGEVILRTWQTAHKMKVQFGPLAGDTQPQRQLSAQALRRQVHDLPGHDARHRANTSAASKPGKWADLVLWKPAFFGVKPELVLKGGMIAYAQMGDANASIPTPQPVFPRPMFASFGRAATLSSLTFVSQAALDAGIVRTLRSATPARRGEELPHDRQEGFAAQRRDAGHSGRSRHLSRLGRRRTADVRAGEGVADGPAVFPVLMNLRLLQLGDSALPIGGYSHSWGLEAAIEQVWCATPPVSKPGSCCWLDHVVGALRRRRRRRGDAGGGVVRLERGRAQPTTCSPPV